MIDISQAIHLITERDYLAGRIMDLDTAPVSALNGDLIDHRRCLRGMYNDRLIANSTQRDNSGLPEWVWDINPKLLMMAWLNDVLSPDKIDSV